MLAKFVKKASSSPGYHELLQDLKGRVRAAQMQAVFAVNRELILLYWSIGRDLSQRFAVEKWGGKIIDRLARDCRLSSRESKGFSPRNPPLHAFSGRGLARG
jgi:hypothetical protein